MRAVVGVLLAVILAGCKSSVEPGRPVEFSVEAVDGHPDDVADVRSRTADRVTVVGAITTPTPCQNFSASVERAAERIVLRVAAHRRGHGCLDVLASFSYRAVLQDVPSGPVRFQVVHTYRHANWPAVVVLDTILPAQ